MANKKKPVIAEEPEISYSATTEKKGLRVFSSFEEEQAATYQYWASLTPIERLREHYILITSIYAEELKHNHPNNRIYFDS